MKREAAENEESDDFAEDREISMPQLELSSIVPWGRSLEEYVLMFDLTESDRRKRILGCGDGPASFNAEWTRDGGSVVSVDPLYQFSAVEIAARIEEIRPTVMAHVVGHLDSYRWQVIQSPADLERVRMAAMTRFLEDFETGLVAGRYREGGLPRLDFADRSFDLALVSHFLFLYSDQIDADFHWAGIRELLRVAREVRIFPLQDLSGARSGFVDPVVDALTEEGRFTAIVKVDYEFQQGANEMLVIR